MFCLLILPQPAPSPNSGSHWSFTLSIVFLFHNMGIIQWVAFSDWLLYLIICILRFFHVLSLPGSPFPLSTEKCFIYCWCFTIHLSLHLLKDMLVAFKIFTIMNKTIIKCLLCLRFLCGHMLRTFCGKIPSNMIAYLHAKSMLEWLPKKKKKML